MRLRWLIFWSAFAVLVVPLLLVVVKSFQEQRMHGYDGGWFLIAVLWALMIGPLLIVWAILNKVLK